MSLEVSEVRMRRARLLTPRSRASKPLGIPFRALLAGIVLWLLAVVLVNSGRRLSNPGLIPGQIARTTILASVEFETMDHSGTKLAQDAAAAAVAPVFRIHLRDSHLRTADLLLDELKLCGGTNDLVTLGRSLRLLRVNIAASQLAAAVPTNKIEVVRQVLKTSVQEAQAQGIIAIADRDTRFQGKASRGRLAVIAPGGGAPEDRDIDRMLTPVTAANILRERLRVVIAEPDLLIGELAGAALEPNLQFEAEATHKRQEEARRHVSPAVKVIRAGSALVEAGKPVSAEMLENLRLHSDRLKALEDPNAVLARWAGSASLLFAGLMAAGGLIVLRRPQHLKNGRLLVMTVILGLLPVGLARLVAMAGVEWEVIPAGAIVYVLPYAISALLAATLVDSILAYALAVWTALASAMLLDASLGVFTLSLVASVVAIFCARDISRRTSLFRAGLWLCAIQMVFSVAVGWINQLDAQALLWQAAAGLIGGILVSVLALLLMPIFEYFGGMTSDIRLLELSDLGHPLLEKLAIDAPGTYHHSLMVAALAQAAASEVGANDLLLRVCAYFHDIGKMTKPEFFIENVPFRKNPHDELSPSMSTMVIVSHVKEGVSLALRYQLPPALIDAIRQHHGTSVVRYFYQRARDQHSPEQGGAPGEENFRYPGPKPQTLEMGILMLADTIEAASRTLEKPSPATIERMVEELTAEKIADGQLDECGMTFSQLGRIKRSFIVTLNNMAHGRIVYPRHEDRSGPPPGEATGPDHPSEVLGRVVAPADD